MSNSLTEIRLTEKYLLHEMAAEDVAVFEAKLLTQPLLKMNTYFLEKTFALVKLYHRKKVREAAEAAHHRLFSDPGEQEIKDQILQLFKR